MIPRHLARIGDEYRGEVGISPKVILGHLDEGEDSSETVLKNSILKTHKSCSLEGEELQV